MCIKLRKPLNPKAQEWRPAPPLPQLSAPPPQQLVVAFTAAPQTELLCCPPPPRCAFLAHYAQCPPPVYTIAFPAKATEAVAPPICEENVEKFDRRNVEGTVVARAKRPESPRFDDFKKRPNKFLPPRLRRAIKSNTHSHPPPPPPKLEWRPKSLENSDSKVPGRGSAAASPPKPKTTLMIRNIPNQLRRYFMLKFLDAHCQRHSLEYDFFYLPFDFRKRGNLGYAFVNLTSSEAANKLMEVLSKFKWRSMSIGVYSGKVCEITWARIQGKEAFIKRFQKSSFRCDDVEFLPVLLDPPRDGTDPNPPPPLNLGRLCPPATT